MYDHIAFAKVQQAGHQRHGLLGTHGGYGGSVDGFQIHPAQFAEPCIDSGLKVGGAGGDRVSMGVGGVCAGNQRLLDTARHRVHG